MSPFFHFEEELPVGAADVAFGGRIDRLLFRMRAAEEDLFEVLRTGTDEEVLAMARKWREIDAEVKMAETEGSLIKGGKV